MSPEEGDAAATSATAEPNAISLVLRVRNLDYHVLSSTAGLVDSVKDVLRKATAAIADCAEDDVAVVFWLMEGLDGIVYAQVRVAPPSRDDFLSSQQLLQSSGGQTDVAVAMGTLLHQLDGISVAAIPGQRMSVEVESVALVRVQLDGDTGKAGSTSGASGCVPGAFVIWWVPSLVSGLLILPGQMPLQA